MDSILSMLNALSSNGLFIAFISAWFTIQMHSIVSAYKEFIKSTQLRIILSRECIFQIEQNRIWMRTLTADSLSISQVLPQIRHIELRKLPNYTSLDELMIQTITYYENSLTLTLAIIVKSRSCKIKNVNIDEFEASTADSVESLNILIDVYQRSLHNSRESFLKQFMKPDKEQAMIQKDLKALALDLRRGATKQSRIDK